jgi:hypothetical protein
MAHSHPTYFRSLVKILLFVTLGLPWVSADSQACSCQHGFHSDDRHDEFGNVSGTFCTTGSIDAGDPTTSCVETTADPEFGGKTTTPVAPDANAATVNAINAVANSTRPVEQNTSVDQGAEVALLGASNRANAAVLECANGANKEVSSAGNGSKDLAACQNDFKEANSFAEMAAKANKVALLSPNLDFFSNENSQRVLQRFENNFGVEQSAYISRMIAERRAGSAFGEMLGTKIAALEKLPNRELEAGVNLKAALTPPLKTKNEITLRDSLKNKMAEATAKRVPASVNKIATDSRHEISPKFENLLPDVADLKLGNSAGEEPEEIANFEVVHLKYRELTARKKVYSH